MLERVIIGGFGGQGVLLMGRLLAMAAVSEGKNACWLPAYGPEKRGGTADCSIIISDGDIPSPLVSLADFVIAMNDYAFEKFEDSVAPGGCLLVNSSLITKQSKRKDIKVYYVPCNEIAIEAGSEKTANMVMLGAFLELSGCVDKGEVLNALLETLGQAKANLIPLNRDAIKRGAAVVTA